jgi:hypothetical protein
MIEKVVLTTTRDVHNVMNVALRQIGMPEIVAFIPKGSCKT